MSGSTAVGLGIGFVYGAVLGVMAYRWWQAREKQLDWRLQALGARIDAVVEREIKAKAQPEQAT